MAAEYREIPDGDLVEKTIEAELNIAFNWDTVGLPSSVQLSSPVFTITVIRPASESSPLLTKDNEGILSGSGNRKTVCRIKAGAAGSKYRVRCKAVTNESPPQTLTGEYFVQVRS